MKNTWNVKSMSNKKNRFSLKEMMIIVEPYHLLTFSCCLQVFFSYDITSFKSKQTERLGALWQYLQILKHCSLVMS